jgi:hypothetical protein
MTIDGDAISAVRLDFDGTLYCQINAEGSHKDDWVARGWSTNVPTSMMDKCEAWERYRLDTAEDEQEFARSHCIDLHRSLCRALSYIEGTDYLDNATVKLMVEMRSPVIKLREAVEKRLKLLGRNK